MDIQSEAPDITPGYPSRGRLLAPAWQMIWDSLRASPDTFQDGTALAARAATAHGLASVTLRALLTRAANAGLLISRSQAVPIKALRRTEAGEIVEIPTVRNRVHYRPSSPQVKQ